MTVMTVLSDRRPSRNGETLIEIMASIMVLAIGLVGVLAAIPFGGFRMAQMTEADASAALGRNAVRMLRVNGWYNPKLWWCKDLNTGYYMTSLAEPFLGRDGEYIDTTIPFVLDPLGATLSYYPYKKSFSPDSNRLVSLVNFCPLPQDETGVVMNKPLMFLRSWYESLFYEQGDLITTYAVNEDESEFRPHVQMEGDDLTQDELNAGKVGKRLINGDDVSAPSFSGRYSWLAFIRLNPRQGVLADRCEFSSVGSADFDAVVFRDRIIGDERAFAADVRDGGYRGGSVKLDLNTCCHASDSSEPISSEDYGRFREQLSQTRYILLVGPDDAPVYRLAGSSQTVARWYKIANFSFTGDSGDEPNRYVRLSLIGEDTPKNWSEGGKVTAIFYPGVIGVYSGTVPFIETGNF